MHTRDSDRGKFNGKVCTVEEVQTLNGGAVIIKVGLRDMQPKEFLTRFMLIEQEIMKHNWRRVEIHFPSMLLSTSGRICIAGWLKLRDIHVRNTGSGKIVEFRRHDEVTEIYAEQ